MNVGKQRYYDERKMGVLMAVFTVYSLNESAKDAQIMLGILQ